MNQFVCPLLLASLSDHFTWIDWSVLIGYLVLVSYLGVRLAGKPKDMEGFFRGGNRLPWYAVSASMIATIISAVTFVSVPAFAYSKDFTYLQFGIIAGFLSRMVVAFVLVPAYYKHKVYSPYDYMGQRLGEAARSVTTALFSLLGMLSQASRVYLTAIILELLLHDQLKWLNDFSGIDSLLWAVGIVCFIAVTWTMLGGIATVIWTDAMLFLVFVIGGIVAIAVMSAEIPGGLAEIVRMGWSADKFKLWTLFATETDVEWASIWGKIFANPYTMWAAVIAVTFGNIGAYGTDQLLAQRIFTCRSQRDAKLAVLSSWTAELVVGLMLLVGVGLWAFYTTYPERLTVDATAAVAANPDAIFPVFILIQVPVALRGLIVAGIFAAAISSLTSILAALSQTTLSAVYLPLRGLSADETNSESQNVEILFVSRCLIVLWGIGLCAMAVAIDRYVEGQKALGRDILFLDLALGIANYVLGVLFAAFLLAWLPIRKNAFGLIWSAPLGVCSVVATAFHQPWTVSFCWFATAVLLGSWLIVALLSQEERGRRLVRMAILALGCGLLFLLTNYLWYARIDPSSGEILRDTAGEILKSSIGWPWYAPISGFVAFTFGYLLGEPREEAN